MTLRATAAVTKTLGHTGRLRILAMLRLGPLSVCQIASVLGTPVSTVSGHLAALRTVGLVCEQRRGKWVFCRLTTANTVVPILGPVLAALEGDPDITRDADTAAALRGRSIDALCAAAQREMRAP